MREAKLGDTHLAHMPSGKNVVAGIEQSSLVSTLAYTVNVAKSVSSFKIKPGSTFIVARTRVNGVLVKQGAYSPSVALKVGTNLVKITVTAENGAVRTYFLTVIRAAK